MNFWHSPKKAPLKICKFIRSRTSEVGSSLPPSQGPQGPHGSKLCPLPTSPTRNVPPKAPLLPPPPATLLPPPSSAGSRSLPSGSPHHPHHEGVFRGAEPPQGLWGRRDFLGKTCWHSARPGAEVAQENMASKEGGQTKPPPCLALPSSSPKLNCEDV